MPRKTYTLLLTTNERGATRKMVMSSARLKAMILLGGLGSLIFLAGVVDYFGLLFQAIENKRLRAENLQLNSQFRVVEGKINALESGLERIKNFTTKLKLITDIEGPDRTLRLSMGIGPSANDLETSELRETDQAPNRRLASVQKDATFLEHPPLDIHSGELSIDRQRNYATLSIRIDQAVQATALREQSILELWEKLSERHSLMNATPSILPVRGWPTSRFGYRLSPFSQRPVMHNGVDIAASPGSPIYAPADAVVSFAGYDSSYGNLVSLDHGYGVVTRYGHNSQIFVVVGQKVRRRDVIAAVGTTGRSTGPHVHYEVRVKDVPVNPINYILDKF